MQSAHGVCVRAPGIIRGHKNKKNQANKLKLGTTVSIDVSFKLKMQQIKFYKRRHKCTNNVQCHNRLRIRAKSVVAPCATDNIV